jgi:hypothetical protein
MSYLSKSLQTAFATFMTLGQVENTFAACKDPNFDVLFVETRYCFPTKYFSSHDFLLDESKEKKVRSYGNLEPDRRNKHFKEHRPAKVKHISWDFVDVRIPTEYPLSLVEGIFFNISRRSSPVTGSLEASKPQENNLVDLLGVFEEDLPGVSKKFKRDGNVLFSDDPAYQHVYYIWNEQLRSHHEIVCPRTSLFPGPPDETMNPVSKQTTSITEGTAMGARASPKLGKWRRG